MFFEYGVHIINEGEMQAVRVHAAEYNLAPFLLETGAGRGREAFFDAVKAVLPLDPPIRSYYSWDALSDSIWEGLHNLRSERIVVLWPDAYLLRRAAPEDFDLAVATLTAVAADLVDNDASMGRPTIMSAYIVANMPRVAD